MALEDSCSSNSQSRHFDATDALAGKIETIQLTNFMCHSNLEINLNSRINFITGRNGSGKSAIMTALVVVLGGTASLTRRGSSISDFIKKGENSARVSITLINKGIKSYKEELYGSRIIICRHITKNGNSYVCKSAKGAVISKKKEEVTNIIVAFNLQITNPICILNQDVARSFLCSSDNNLRFIMFMKATQLEELKMIYLENWELLFKSKEQLQKKQKAIEEAKKDMSELEEKLQHFASLEKQEQVHKELENEYLWSIVVNEENKVKQLTEELGQLLQKKNKYLDEEKNYDSLIKQSEAEIEKFQNGIDELKTKKMEKSGEKGKLQKNIQNIEREIEKIETQSKSLESKKNSNTAEINGVKKYLEQKDSIASQNQAEKELANKRINSLSEDLSNLKDELANVQRNFNKIQEMKTQHLRNIENTKADLGELEQNKKRVEILLMGMKEKGRNNVLKFGEFTKVILKHIEEADKRKLFIRRPVGPCGMHVTLSGDPKWARAVESVIGGLMNTYCCDNQKDFQVLSRIMEKVCENKQPQIIISKFLKSRHNIEDKKVTYRGLSSILDVLKFDNDVVFNTFIDQARIETILLFETDNQAASILTHIQNVPKNLSMGLTLQSDQYFPAPNYRTYYGNPDRPLRYFDAMSKGSDNAKKLEAELIETGRKIQEKNLELISAKQKYQEISERLTESMNTRRKLKQNEEKIQLELNQLKDIEDSRPIIKTKVVLEGELQVLEEKHKEISDKISQCLQLLDPLKKRREESVEQLNFIAIADDAVESEITTLEENLERKKLECRQILKRKEKSNEIFSRIDNKRVDLEKEIEQSTNELEKKKKEAKKVCPARIETERSPEEVHKLLEKCEKYVETAKQLMGSNKDTITEYKEKLELFKKIEKSARLLEKEIKIFTKITNSREKRLEIIQEHIAGLVNFNFRAILQTRGYDGFLRIDFENKSLEIEVKPKDESAARKDSKTLSGGERSYSTVSFILAIWKVVQMPVYFLDEFDVFMDKINRKVIMDLLLDHATYHSNEQFVFITPQDISSIKNSETVSVYKMPDPERKT